MTETKHTPPVSHRRDNIEQALPQIVEALKATPFGEVKIIMARGRVKQLLKTERIQVEE